MERRLKELQALAPILFNSAGLESWLGFEPWSVRKVSGTPSFSDHQTKPPIRELMGYKRIWPLCSGFPRTMEIGFESVLPSHLVKRGASALSLGQSAPCQWFLVASNLSAFRQAAMGKQGFSLQVQSFPLFTCSGKH